MARDTPKGQRPGSRRDSAREWVGLLEEHYGVSREFAGHLAPLLERLARGAPSREDWDTLLGGVAAAFRASRTGAEARPSEELDAMLDQFSTELQKLDESMKVLTAFLERLERRVKSAAVPAPRVLH